MSHVALHAVDVLPQCFILLLDQLEVGIQLADCASISPLCICMSFLKVSDLLFVGLNRIPQSLDLCECITLIELQLIFEHSNLPEQVISLRNNPLVFLLDDSNLTLELSDSSSDIDSVRISNLASFDKDEMFESLHILLKLFILTSKPLYLSMLIVSAELVLEHKFDTPDLLDLSLEELLLSLESLDQALESFKLFLLDGEFVDVCFIVVDHLVSFQHHRSNLVLELVDLPLLVSRLRAQEVEPLL